MAIKVEGHQKLKKSFEVEIETLQKTASGLGMKETANKLTKIKDALISDRFRLLVVGRFKNGKSTLLNALLGQPTKPVPGIKPGEGPMPVNYIPCTATLTLVTYAENPYVRVWRTNGTCEDWTFERYLKEATVKIDNEETQRFFETIRMFEVGYPAELCKGDVDILDSPGTSDTPQRTQYTRQAAETADAAVAIFRSQPFAGEDELEFVQEAIVDSNTRPFYVVNMWDGHQPDEQAKSYFWNRLVNFWQGGPKYTGQEFSSRNIFLIDARQAEKGKLSGNTALVNDSGLGKLEQTLSAFLMSERHMAHLLKFSTTADKEAGAIEENISRQSNALAQDAENIRKVYESTQTSRAEIRRRKDRLPGVMDKYQSDAQRELKLGFERVFNRLEANLPSALEGYKLPSAGGFLSMFKKQKMGNEAAAFCADYIERELKQWGGKNGDAQKALKKVLDSMIEEVASEITRIEREYRDIHIEMSGMGTTSGTQVGPGMADRILSTAFGFATGDPSAILTGFTDGWRGLALTITTQIGIVVVGTILGLSAPVLIPVAIMGAILSRGLVTHFTGENDAKQTVLKRILDGDPAATPPTPPLRDLRLKIHSQIDQDLAKHFGEIRTRVIKEVDAAIREEEAAIEKVFEDSRRSLDEKIELSKKLESARLTVVGVRTRIKDLIARARQ